MARWVCIDCKKLINWKEVIVSNLGDPNKVGVFRCVDCHNRALKLGKLGRAQS